MFFSKTFPTWRITITITIIRKRGGKNNYYFHDNFSSPSLWKSFRFFIDVIDLPLPSLIEYLPGKLFTVSLFIDSGWIFLDFCNAVNLLHLFLLTFSLWLNFLLGKNTTFWKISSTQDVLICNAFVYLSLPLLTDFFIKLQVISQLLMRKSDKYDRR